MPKTPPRGATAPEPADAKNGKDAPKTAARRKTASAGGESAVAPNLALWDRLRRTDPRATKPFTRSGGFRGTQIDPTWRMQMMTEVFGPVGEGWGYEIFGKPKVVEKMVFIGVRVWYIKPGDEPEDRTPDLFVDRYTPRNARWTGVQYGGTELLRTNRSGTATPNDEAFKMAVTDGLGKCLVQLGLAADVHMGQFDDAKYRDELDAYYAKKDDPSMSPEAIASFEKETKQKVGDVRDLDALDDLWRGGVSAKLREIGVVDKSAQHRVVAYFSQKKAELMTGASARPPLHAVDGGKAPPDDETDPQDRQQRETDARGSAKGRTGKFELLDEEGAVKESFDDALKWCSRLYDWLETEAPVADLLKIWENNRRTVEAIREGYPELKWETSQPGRYRHPAEFLTRRGNRLNVGDA